MAEDETLKVYLAGPFFNDEQRSVIDRLEKTLDSYCKVYSPRRDGGVLAPDSTVESRKNVFEMNYKHIADCDLMIAQVEGLDGRPLGLFKQALQRLKCLKLTDSDLEEVKEELQKLVSEQYSRLPNYTDIGTVWEMGCAYEIGIPVIAFSPNVQRQVNLMLSESCRGFATKYEDLIPAISKVMSGGEFSPHRGKIQ